MVYRNGNVYLQDLKEDKSISVKINKKFKKYLKDSIKLKYKTLYQFQKKSNMDTIYNFFFYNPRIKLPTIIKLIKTFNLNLKELEKNIIWIGTKTGYGIRNPKFPFNFQTKEGYRFIASILGDGSLKKDIIVEYNNQKFLLINKVRESAIKIFGKIDGITKRINEDKVIRLAFPKIIGKIILKLGLKPGRKTIINPNIPNFILNGSKENKIEFLKQISDDEGSPQINIPYSYSIRFSFAVQNKIRSPKVKSNLTIDLHKLVNSLNYNTTKVYSTKSYECTGKNKGINRGYMWAFDIQGKEHITRFYNEVGFRVKSRQIKLLKGIKSIKRNQLGTKRMYKAATNNFKIVYNKNGFVTKHNLAKQANISLRNSIEWLRKLHKKNLIKIKKHHNFIHNGRNICGLKGRTPNEYILT